MVEAPRRIMVELSSRCNLHCSMCGSHSRQYAALQDKQHGFMPPDLFRRLVDQLVEDPRLKNCDLVMYGFGEPLVNPNTIDCIEYCIAKNIPLQPTINTNGMLVNEELIGRLAALRFPLNITFSLDGFADRNDAIRIGSKFDVVMRNIEQLDAALRKADNNLVRLQINTTYDGPLDDEYMSGFVEYVTPLVDLIQLQRELGYNGEFPSVVPDRPVKCNFPLHDLGVRWDGHDTYACCLDWNGFYPTRSDFFTNSIVDIWNSSSLETMRQTINSDTPPMPCAACCRWMFDSLPTKETISATEYTIYNDLVKISYNLKRIREKIGFGKIAFIGMNPKFAPLVEQVASEATLTDYVVDPTICGRPKLDVNYYPLSRLEEVDYDTVVLLTSNPRAFFHLLKQKFRGQLPRLVYLG